MRYRAPEMLSALALAGAALYALVEILRRWDRLFQGTP